MVAPHIDEQQVLDWLLEGDVAIRYAVHRDLLGVERPDLQARIATEGWGARFLAVRRSDGHWGQRYYQPKWTSTHYTLQDLRKLELPRDQPEAVASVQMVLSTCIGDDGGIDPRGLWGKSDCCVNAMALDFCAWFGGTDAQLQTLIDWLLDHRLDDGGYNCRCNRAEVRHSSVHSTLSVLEAIQTTRDCGLAYRADELAVAADAAREFLLMHRLFKSDRTGEVIHPAFLRLSYPGRWRYDILRALDHFRLADHDDPRLADALQVVRSKRRRDGRWNLQAKHQGAVHFDMEAGGKPSRWNTLRALRVLRRLT